MGLLPLAIQTLVQKTAAVQRVDPALLTAMVSTESSGRPFCTKYEPQDLKYVLDAEAWAQRTAVSTETETAGQLFSWGLLQIMGYSARELGFRGLLPELSQAELGLTFGIYKLKRLEMLYAKAPSVVLGYDEAVIASYNEGSPRKNADGSWRDQSYVDEVRSRFLAAGGKLP